VRDIVEWKDRLILTTTDRISAFDRVLTTIPHKGEILNRISCSWFKQVSDLVPVHILEELSPRTVVVRKTRVLPLEVVVRGYLTGSAYRAYQAGKSVSGIQLPKGMKKNEPIPIFLRRMIREGLKLKFIPDVGLSIEKKVSSSIL
jgi:phosphoribosylaminoimidazole-succinocarboxamide synthase